MKNVELIQKYQESLVGITLEKIINADYGNLSIKKNSLRIPYQDDFKYIGDSVLVDKIINPDELLKIEKEMESLSLSPAVCFEKRTDLLPLINFFEEQVYEEEFEAGCWVFPRNNFSQKKVQSYEIKKIEDVEELSALLKTYEQFIASDSRGETLVSSYLERLEVAWRKGREDGSFQIDVFGGYLYGRLSSGGVLISREGVGFISDIFCDFPDNSTKAGGLIGQSELADQVWPKGSDPESLMIQNCINHSFNRGNISTCAVEELVSEEDNIYNESSKYKESGGELAFSFCEYKNLTAA